MRTIIIVIAVIAFSLLCYFNIKDNNEISTMKVSLTAKDSVISYEGKKINLLKSNDKQVIEINNEINSLISNEYTLLKQGGEK
jgi:hypothetical protein